MARKKKEVSKPEDKTIGVNNDAETLAKNLDIAAVFTLGQNSGTYIVPCSKEIKIDNTPTYK